jgi:pimeloyl-ACP methyl ester carboxylesterase
MKKLLISVVLMMFVMLGLAGCSKSDNPNAKKTFVLVHGAWQAPYVWDMVKSQLEAKGQKVIVVELPAHGNDMTSPAAVSIDVYSDKVIAAIESVNGKVILVGHSMGGVVVTAVAEKIPSRIEKLVYIGAFLPANGQSLMDLAMTDAQSILGPNLIPSKDQLTLDVIHDKIIDIFCQDASADIQKEVLAKFRVEPAIPFGNKVALTEANFGSVMKYYIHTSQDHAVGIDLQNRMVTAAHITKTYTLDTGHSPFLTKPDEVTVTLLTIMNN